MRNGFDDILDDHRRLLDMLAEYRATHDDGLAHEICTEIALHARAEEETLYPRLRQLGSGEGPDPDVVDGIALVERALAEHADVETHAARVLGAPPADLTELMAHIDRHLTAHVRFEEAEVLPRLRPIIDAEALHDAFTGVKDAARSAAGAPRF